MDFKRWADEMSAALERLKSIDLGFPQSNNVVHEVLKNRSPSSEMTKWFGPDFVAFYDVCDGVSLPDVHNGYFIKSLAALNQGYGLTEPRSLNGTMQDDIVVFGSTGGGHRFARLQTDGRIVKLGNGLIEGRVFRARIEDVVVVAKTFDIFCELLLRDVRAFVSGEDGHCYL